MDDNEREALPAIDRVNEDNQNGGASKFLSDAIRRGKFDEPTWTDTLYQVLASCIVHCIVIQAGVNMVYSNVLAGGLRASNNTNNGLVIDTANESWIASLVTITLPVGALIAGPLMDKFGRKSICIGLCLPIMISWTMIIIADSLVTIYAARIIAGMTAGLTTVGLVYVNEITHPRVRPMLLCMNSVFVSLGVLLTGIFALWLDWRRIAGIFLAMNATIFFGLFAIPESPYWLMCFGRGYVDEQRIARAEKSLRWLNPRPLMYEQEYNRIKEMSRNRFENAEKSLTKSIVKRTKNYLKEIGRPTVYKPMILLAVIFVAQQLSGAYVVVFYAIKVFREIGGNYGNDFHEYGALLLLGLIKFFMSVLTACLSRRIGRRALCMASGIGMTLAMFSSATFVYLMSDGNDDLSKDHRRWMLLVIVLFYVCASTIGFVVIPWTLIGELLPISFRGIGGGIMMSFAYVVMFAVVKTYPFALDAVGSQNMYIFFGLASFGGTAVIYFFLPETLGKSFKDIENFFEDKRKNEDRR